MRTIKLRGKEYKTGKWIYFNKYVEYPFKHDYIHTVKHLWVDINPETVGQFIGLKDKNGEEIFEGDILDFNGIITEVRFVRGVFAFLVNGNLDDELCGDCRTDLFAKIISNIHENPDILKESKK